MTHATRRESFPINLTTFCTEESPCPILRPPERDIVRRYSSVKTVVILIGKLPYRVALRYSEELSLSEMIELGFPGQLRGSGIFRKRDVILQCFCGFGVGLTFSAGVSRVLNRIPFCRILFPEGSVPERIPLQMTRERAQSIE